MVMRTKSRLLVPQWKRPPHFQPHHWKKPALASFSLDSKSFRIISKGNTDTSMGNKWYISFLPSAKSLVLTILKARCWFSPSTDNRQKQTVLSMRSTLGGQGQTWKHLSVAWTNLQKDGGFILTFHQVVDGFKEPSHRFFKLHLFFAFIKPARRHIWVILKPVGQTSESVHQPEPSCPMWEMRAVGRVRSWCYSRHREEPQVLRANRHLWTHRVL